MQTMYTTTFTTIHTNKSSRSSKQQKRRSSSGQKKSTFSDDESDQDVYTNTVDMITPPPSPKSSPFMISFEANERLLTAKRNGQLKPLMSEYNALKKQGLLLTDHTFNLFFDAYSNIRRDGAPLAPMMKVYEDMVELKINPSSSTYSILIRTLCRRDVEVQKIVAMLKRQCARSGTSKVTNNTAELLAEENLQKALSLFEKAASDNVTPLFDVELYNQLLRVLSHYGNIKDALYIYQTLETYSTPSSATFAALINLFGRAGDLDSALVYFNKFKELDEPVSPHDSSYIYNALVDAHLKCDCLEGALKVVSVDMFRADVKITTIPYNSIIRYYCTHNRMEEAQALIESMKESSPTPDASSYGPMLSVYCQQQDFEKATELYHALIETDISKSYGNLANYALLCVNKKDKKAIEVVQSMQMAGLEPDPVLSERIITCFPGQDGLAALQAVIKAIRPRSLTKGIHHIKSASVKMTAGNTDFEYILKVARLISPLCNELPLEIASRLVKQFDDAVTQLEESDYAILFSAAVSSKFDTSFVFKLQKVMYKNKVAVSSTSSALVLCYLEQMGDLEAMNNWEKLLEAVVPVVSFTSKTDAVSNNVMKAAVNNQPQVALDILRSQIIDAGMIPSPEALRDAIAFIGKQGHLEIALSMYHLCIDSITGCNMDSARSEKAVYMLTNSILIAYAQQGDMLNAKKYYEQIKAMHRYPDGNGYASLLLGSAKCATDEATDALIIYDEAKRHNVKPTTFFYNVVISKLAKARKLEAAMKLFEEMQSFHILPNSITYGAVISASVRAGSESVTCKLFNEMMASPTFQPRIGPFNNMIQFYVRQQPNREKALFYFSELQRCQIRPSAHTYKLLMEAYCTIAPYDMPTAYRMLGEMQEKDHIRPLATHYATLIYSYGCLQRDVQSAQRVFSEMAKRGIGKDEVVYQAMLDTLISNDQFTSAEHLYQQMQQDIRKSSCPYIENVFIRGYGRKGLLSKAKALFDAMSDDKISSDPAIVIREPSTYEAMVRACIDNKNMVEAKKVFDLMVEREFPEKVTAVVAELISAA
ncbi:hypothetical protein K501DRAFT_228787 [Backusella circina FSU 941]|nr:hypothetical protein K501DRAFT_228787 [Backusella circina FSU 941]